MCFFVRLMIYTLQIHRNLKCRMLPRKTLTVWSPSVCSSHIWSRRAWQGGLNAWIFFLSNLSKSCFHIGANPGSLRKSYLESFCEMRLRMKTCLYCSVESSGILSYYTSFSRNRYNVWQGKVKYLFIFRFLVLTTINIFLLMFCYRYALCIWNYRCLPKVTKQ